jgi:hypothetical protein
MNLKVFIHVESAKEVMHNRVKRYKLFVTNRSSEDVAPECTRICLLMYSTILNMSYEVLLQVACPCLDSIRIYNIQNTKLNWICHVERMNPECISKQLI